MENLQSISKRLQFGRPFHAFVQWLLRTLLFGYQRKTFNMSRDILVFGTCLRQNQHMWLITRTVFSRNSEDALVFD